MKDLIKNNLKMKILSVGIGILIWFLVSSSNDPVVTKRYSNISVDMINSEALTDSGVTYSIESGDTVDIVVKGNQSVVNQMSKSDFSATADLSQLTSWGTANIQVTAQRFPERLDISLGSTQVVKVQVEEIDSRSIKVVVTANGDPADGYVVGTTAASPGLIDVEGPESKVNKITAISVGIDVTGASENVKEKVSSDEFVLYDDDGEEITGDQLTFGQKSLTASATILMTREISIIMETTGSPADGYSLASLEYEPKKVTVVGSEDDLKGLKRLRPDKVSIEGRTKDYTDEIELTDEYLEEKTGKEISLYDDSVDAISFKAVIEKTVERKISFKGSDIEIKNNDNNYKVTFSNDSYSLSVRGAESVVKSLKIEDFEPYINMESIELAKNTESEEHTMRFHYTEPDGVYVTSVPEETIRITVSQ